MSRKHKKPKQRKSFPWWIVAVGGILLIVAAFYLANHGSGNSGGTPSIAVDQQKIDYGDQSFGTNLTFSIKVTNAGDGILRFREDPYIQVLEGC